MKIAILTLPLGRNYGGIMQAYALQQTLKNMGHEVTTLDRHANSGSVLRRLASFTRKLVQKAAGKRRAPLFFDKHLPIIFRHTYAFINRHIDLSGKITSEKQLQDHFDNAGYDAVIVGSDQVWRPRYAPNIYNYYLDFVRDKRTLRIAYAASFGTEQWEYSQVEAQRCADLAKRFDRISVRERSAVGICRSYLGVDAAAVLDPTLLLDREHYLDVIGATATEVVAGSIFAYWLDPTAGKLAATELLAERLQKPVASCKARLELGDVSSADLQDYQMPPLEQWLASFANADLVLTDSFHGVIFSIIFAKPFIAVVNNKRGAARFESILKALGLEHNLVHDADEVTQLDIAALRISASSQQQLARLKNESLQFLSEALQVNERQ